MWVLFAILALSILSSMVSGVLRSVGGGNDLTVDSRTDGYVIGFFNGVNTSMVDAAHHQVLLRRRFGDKTTSGQPIQYQIFYNDSYGMMLDIIETFDQRAALVGLNGHYDLFWGLASGDRRGLDRVAGDIPGGVVFVEDMARLFSGETVSYLRALQQNKVIKTSAGHRKIIEHLTGKKSKQRLVLVAHSQGNLYALPAYSYAIKRNKSVAIIHAAPPLDALKGDFILSNRDVVINALRQIGRVPVANVDLPPCGAEDCADVFEHGFAEVYFNQNNEAGQKTAASIEKVLE